MENSIRLPLVRFSRLANVLQNSTQNSSSNYTPFATASRCGFVSQNLIAIGFFFRARRYHTLLCMSGFFCRYSRLPFLRALFYAYQTPLCYIPGPLPARSSRFWLLRAYISRSFHGTNRSLHETYGMHRSSLLYTIEPSGDRVDSRLKL